MISVKAAAVVAVVREAGRNQEIGEPAYTDTDFAFRAHHTGGHHTRVVRQAGLGRVVQGTHEHTHGVSEGIKVDGDGAGPGVDVEDAEVDVTELAGLTGD
jgi:hypothetical protein